MGSIPARSRHGATLAFVSLLLVGCPALLTGQQTDSARAGVRLTARDTAGTAAVDSLAPPISARRAFLYSLALPGLGQSRLGRSSAGAVYFGFELTSIAMLGKSAYDLRVAKRRVREHIVNRYRLDALGRPMLDSLNRPIPRDTVPNRYATTGTDELRSRVKARKLHYEDWVAMLAFTHLFAAADAFVAAHLWDLPQQVEIRRLPGGATGVGARLRFR